MKALTIRTSFIFLLILSASLVQGQFEKAIIEPAIAQKKKVMVHPKKSDRQLTALSGEAMHNATKHWNKSVKHLGIKHEQIGRAHV